MPPHWHALYWAELSIARDEMAKCEKQKADRSARASSESVIPELDPGPQETFIEALKKGED
jgi:hypothetical protein